MPNHQIQSKGNTLIEVIVAMAIMVLGLTAMLSLAIASLTMSSMTKERVVALNLAREGIELTRAIRDTNWLRDDLCWDTTDQCGLKDGSWTVDYTDQDSLSVRANNEDITLCTNCSLVQGSVIDSSDALDTKILYKSTDSTGIPIVYKRMIKIENISGEKRVLSTVWWTEKGRSHTLKLKNTLTNWR